ncbi:MULTISPECIES: ABC transporter ATP-binding protein [Bacillus]|uniref:ABC transporter ATP-binding protein n=1 Tax=Bacillus glycinifermentans TaxID=1664069 RepID=A0AAJ3YYB3_9BACI|nr:MULTISPECIES: ABC transporter ATP-binding protein [Bacillus]KKB73147.1 sodium ABC transporter ATP-binding protein [Bacillus sp. TH008]MBU8785125.1 ABC transporter ATP-binding protein [Bacillus glycinifermentans]MDU0071425.1 ABC transporter ATP-binding protein [Bacillus sp. IG6]MED8019275.1 ABC transporter ATP-binding protein [Bacillus glycinifermentans]NUJ15295.1 ABC transporter ATP-binding protein [Bacillus glycinifermentans]
MSNILEIKNVSKSYQDFSLKNVSITLQKGYIMGFIGPNGAGKSTTIKLIMNIIKKDSGDISIFGLDHERHQLDIKQRIGFVYDENHFYEELTIEEMKGIVSPFYARWDEAVFQQYAKDFRLPLKRRIKDLSKGMKMKFSLAIALSHHADLLIMDEPTSGLDPLVRSELLDVLQTLLQDENKSIFFSTHITSDLEKVADFITFIQNGEIVLSKAKDELLEEYCIVKGHHDKLDAGHEDVLIGLKKNSFGFEALAKDKREVVQRFGDSVIIEKPTLEDIMVFSTGRSDQSVSSY